VISGMEHQKIFVQTLVENIETEFVPSVFRYIMGASISLGQGGEKRDFVLLTLFFLIIFEIIKMKLVRKVSRYLDMCRLG
jgi:hypothetical protein